MQACLPGNEMGRAHDVEEEDSRLPKPAMRRMSGSLQRLARAFAVRLVLLMTPGA